MTGIRRTAVASTAFLLLPVLTAPATAETPQHALPVGTAVVFVSDAPLAAGRREGDTVPVHLRDALVLDGITLAPAGTHAELVIGGFTTSDGKRHPAVSINRFTINAGLMPVRAVTPIVAPVAAGAEIPATTVAIVEHIGDRFSIRVPFPYSLPVDKPAAYYTPTPARTAPPRTITPPRRSTPAPSPSASVPPSAPPRSDAGTATSPLPSPAATKIPQ